MSVAEPRALETAPWKKLAWACLYGLIGLNILFQFFASWPQESLRDFGTFYESGSAALDGRNPYEIHENSYRVTIKHFDGANPNLNPPASLLVFAPISLFEPHLTLQVIWWGSLITFLTVLLILNRIYRPPGGNWLVIWAISMPGFWGTIMLGQIYVVLLIAVAAAWILQDRGRLVAAGLLIGLVAAFKTNFLVWPVLLLFAGHWRTAVPAFGSFTVLSVLPVLFFGPQVYDQWIEMIVNDDPARILWVTNMSVIAYASRLGLPWLGQLVAAAILLGLAWWAWRRRPGARDTGLVAIIAGLLASPVAWIHYGLFLLPPLYATAWTRTMAVGAILLVTPRPVANGLFYGPAWMEVTLGSLYIWGLLLLALPLCKLVILDHKSPFATVPGERAV
jgi:hypothetical protein